MPSLFRLLALVAWAALARADVTLAPLFTDHAVLQRDKLVPVWGEAEPGERVKVTFAGQVRGTVAGPDRRWVVLLDPLPANGTGADLTVEGRTTVVVRDVVVGEVWFCSGQSNMEWPVERAANAAQEIKAANYPLLRHVKVERTVATEPARRVATTAWQAATPANVASFTAVGYFFARELHQKLKVPVGLVNCSWGGTPVESWLSPAALASDPAFAVVGERWRQGLAEYPAAKAAYDAALEAWRKADAVAKATGPSAYRAWQKDHPRPRAPRGAGDPWTPSGLFHGMVNPVLPFAVRGVLWYQGESNAERAGEYHALFTALIRSWRSHFGDPDLPFYWVSLAGYRNPADPTGISYALIRDAQTRALALPQTGQALAIDVGEADDIHPKNKQEVGRRLALLAKRRIHGFTGDDTGPTVATAVREGSAVRITFTPPAAGLLARGKPAQALELAGADGVFHRAEARIERETLVVSSRAVPQPEAVRYAWSNYPEANLANSAGLPAVPFSVKVGP